jgi:hypothetical protein
VEHAQPSLRRALLNVDRIPFWATAVLIACAAWQLSVAAHKLPALPRAVQLILTFLLVTCVVASLSHLERACGRHRAAGRHGLDQAP